MEINFKINQKIIKIILLEEILNIINHLLSCKLIMIDNLLIIKINHLINLDLMPALNLMAANLILDPKYLFNNSITIMFLSIIYIFLFHCRKLHQKIKQIIKLITPYNGLSFNYFNHHFYLIIRLNDKIAIIYCYEIQIIYF